MALAEAPSSLASNTTEPLEPPVPPRFWWLKRLTAFALVYFALLAGVRWWWGRIADRRLAALIADARARGEPVFPEEFAPRKVPDDQNAAILFDQATAALVVTPQFSRLVPPDEFTPLNSSQRQSIKSMVNTNRAVLALVRQASTRPSVSWTSANAQPWRVKGPPRRELGRFLYCAALSSHADGNDREALSLVEDLLLESRVMDSGPTTILAHVVAGLMERDAILAVYRIAHDLRVDSEQANAATPQQVHRLISQLLDDPYYHLLDVRSMFALRANQIGLFHEFESVGSGLNPALMPMYRMDAVRSLEWLAQNARASAATNWPAASAALRPNEQPFAANLYTVTRLITLLTQPAVSGKVKGFYEAAVNRRVAAVELAIRLYQIDHGGSYPPSLDDLVPAYIAAVPRDAMTADDHPIGYQRNGGPPVIVTAEKEYSLDLSAPAKGSPAQDRLKMNRERNTRPATKAAQSQSSTIHESGK